MCFVSEIIRGQKMKAVFGQKCSTSCMTISRSYGKFHLALFLFLRQWNITITCVVYRWRVSSPHDCLWYGECFPHSSSCTPTDASLVLCLNPKSLLWIDSEPWWFCRIESTKVTCNFLKKHRNLKCSTWHLHWQLLRVGSGLIFHRFITWESATIWLPLIC